MPLPFLIGLGAAALSAISAASTGTIIAGTVATGAAVAVGGAGVISGVSQMKYAQDDVERAQSRDEAAKKKFKQCNDSTNATLEKLGKKEAEIIASFKTFSDYWEKIHNRPEFADIEIQDKSLPVYELPEVKKVSLAANTIISGLGAAGAGAGAAFAAKQIITRLALEGPTPIIVYAGGTAGTTAGISALTAEAGISTLTAGTSAMFAGGAGIGASALGTTLLVPGIGILVGGAVFALSGKKLREKGDKALSMASDTEKKVEEACNLLNNLKKYTNIYHSAITKVYNAYTIRLEKFKRLVDNGNIDWKEYSAEDIKIIKNIVLLVQLLYTMCSTKIIIDNNSPKVDKKVIDNMIKESNMILSELG